ncbi:MAG: glycosyltransferase family 2 protein, partial [Verrucomicrobia bacterium]|nr:glycosyltransferase family 2 protein [Verrucomicrobiota bacterium]
MLKLGDAEKLKISEGKPWPEFKVFRQENAGPGAARNRGLAEATGEFIHFFDSHDIASQNKHEVQLEALLRTGADIAYGPWVKGRFMPAKQAGGVTEDELPDSKGILEDSTQAGLQVDSQKIHSSRSANDHGVSEHNPESVLIRAIRGSKFPVYDFSAEGPVLQARGLPKGDLLKALLTNWSVVPHACLFRRSILERAGGFPEDIWVGEDQLLFLRCLLAGAKVVHTPETLVLYRLGEEGKLTESKDGHVRRVTHWARFLVKASQEVGPHAEARRRGDFLTTDGSDIHGWGESGQRLGKPSGAAFSNPLPSELARDCANTSPIRSADVPASSPETSHSSLATAPEALAPASSYSLPVTTPPSAWFGFRLRAYLAWRDLVNLEKRDPGLEKEIELIWKRSRFSGFRFPVSGFVFQKLGGLKQRVFGHRWSAAFRCGEMGFKS